MIRRRARSEVDKLRQVVRVVRARVVLVGGGLKLGAGEKEFLVMRIDEADGQAPWRLARLALLQVVNRLAGNLAIAEISGLLGEIADSALQIVADRIGFGHPLETIRIEQFVRSSMRDREVPFADIRGLITGLLQQPAISRVVPFEHRLFRHYSGG